MFNQLEEDITLLIQDFEADEIGKEDFIEQLKAALKEYKEELD